MSAFAYCPARLASLMFSDLNVSPCKRVSRVPRHCHRTRHERSYFKIAKGVDECGIEDSCVAGSW